ncbi:MAG: DNA-protecting protein DprA, partial [Maribacter sp.]|nr:DNA-protecting protein DprA [Maribacter sp.]
LDEVEKTIYSYLQIQGKQLLDRIALDCQLPIYKASSTLLNMEMKGVIRPLPGKLFEVT